MPKKFLISQEEKERILSLHENVNKKKPISEQIVTNYDSKYDYKKDNDDYFFKLKSSETWKKASGKALDAIKTKVYNNKGLGQKTNTESLPDTPFKNSKEGNEFRQWVNNTYPKYANSINLDREGNYNNNYIKKAWSKYGDEYSKVKKPKTTKSKINIMPGINPIFANQINWKKLSTNDSTKNICKSDTTQCAEFVNDWDDRISSVGNAWIAYRNDSVMGPTIYSAFKNLNNDIKNQVIKLWQTINKKGGGKENGTYSSQVRNIVDKLVPKTGSNPPLKPGDYVGIFYPPSSHHEEAFYEGGEAWFVNGEPGNTIKRGDGWGMNTHIGIVAATKDGIPLVFHNIGGNVISDPANKLRIAWVKRKS